jgi:hypothetical protein
MPWLWTLASSRSGRLIRVQSQDMATSRKDPAVLGTPLGELARCAKLDRPSVRPPEPVFILRGGETAMADYFE